MSRKHFDSFNSLYRLPTPENRSLRHGLGEAYIFTTRPICAKCDTPFPGLGKRGELLYPGFSMARPLRIAFPKWETVSGMAVLRRCPAVNDEDVMSELMVKACNIGVGCWRECGCGRAWNMKCRANCVELGKKDRSGFGAAREGDCPCICSCNPGCGNRGWYPCRCGYARIFHRSGCPVGDFKRDSSFLLPYARQRMMESARKRYG